MHHCFLLSVTISSFDSKYVTSKGQNRLTNQTQLSNLKYQIHQYDQKDQNCQQGLNGQSNKKCQKVQNG